MFKKLLFWQPAKNFSKNTLGRFLFFFFEWIVLASAIFLSGWFLLTNNYSQLILFWKMLIISEVIHSGGKLLSPWKRPFYKNGVKIPRRRIAYSKGSFPSGHGLRVVILVYFLARESQVLFWIFAPSLILSVFSRVAFFLHYPIDIMGGALLGYLLVRFIK